MKDSHEKVFKIRNIKIFGKHKALRMNRKTSKPDNESC